jgi:predicted PurR-regulated permease PerM
MQLIIGAVFLMHLIMAPLTFTQIQSTVKNVDRAGNVPKPYSPFQHVGESFIISDFSGIEILTNMEVNHIIDRNIRDFQRIINRSFQSTVLPIINLGILIYYSLYVSRRLYQKKSVLATSNGGHAPPQRMVLNNNIL